MPSGKNRPTMKYRKFFSCSLVIAAGLLAWGCEKDDICPENSPKTPTARILFVQNNQGLTEKYEQTGLHFYGLEGKVRKEEISLNERDTLIALPIDFESTRSRYLIEKEGRTDTLTLDYTPELQFVSKACGFRFTFSQVTVECTLEGPVLEMVPDIESSPANGELYDYRQVTAKLYFNAEEE